MRRFFSIFVIISALLSSGCTQLTSVSNTTLNYKKTAEWNYTGEQDIFIVEDSVGTVKISGDIGGKTVYLALVNTSDEDIPARYSKYISAADARSASEDDFAQLQNAGTSSIPKERFHHFRAEFEPKVTSSSSSRTIDNPVSEKYSPVAQIENYSVGETKKSLYTITGENTDGSYIFKQKEAVLWAYNDICNLWIVSDDTYIAKSEKADLAQKYADAFEVIYPAVRTVFGNESDEIYYSYGIMEWTTKPMDYLSDTGTKVNIVMYDLFNDGDSGETLGFFNPMDYYPSDDDYKKIVSDSTATIGSHSNEGKYFYIDSYYAKEEMAMIISTLAHEFQHMVSFGIKKMGDGLDTDSNFDEMLSMLCEDMMQQFLNDKGFTLSDKDSPRERLLQFMVEYYNCGIRDYDSTSLAYANAYAFGAWLCRQYGGAALVKEMMSNHRVNNSCIVAAVNVLNDKSFSFNELFGQFIKACYGKDSVYTFNQDAAQTLEYKDGETSYSYPMTAINLWEENSMYDLSTTYIPSDDTEVTWKEYLQSSTTFYGTSLLDSSYSYLGPAVFNQAAAMTSICGSYGMFLLRKENPIRSGATSYTISFSSPSGVFKSGLLVYLYLK